MHKLFERRTSVGGNLSYDCRFNLGNSEIRFGARQTKEQVSTKKKKLSFCSSTPATRPLTEQPNFHSEQICSANQFGLLVEE